VSKICYVIGTLEIGGAERQLLKLLKYMDKEKFLPVFIALRGGAMRKEFEKMVKVIVIGKRWKIDPVLLFRLIKVIKAEKPDILHTSMFTSNTWGRIAGKIAHVPFIIGSELCVDLGKRWYHRLMDRALLPFTDIIIANSDAVKKFYQKTERIPEEKLIVINNGVELEELPDIEENPLFRENLGIEKKGFIIGAGGRFTEQKGFMYLLRAIPEVLKVYPESTFIFVGDGPLRQYFEDYVRENKLKGSVVFTGYRKDILKIFALCDIIAVPSVFEGLPNVVLEGMFLSKPVIGTDIPEIAYLVDDGTTGLLVPVKNTRELAEKIILLLQKPELRRSMGEKGHNVVRDRFSLSAMVRNYEKVYSEGKRINKCARYVES